MADVGLELATLPRLLRERVERYGDARYVAAGTVRLTFAELLDRSRRLAAGLHDLGVRPGDRVGTILPNRIETLETIFATAELGAIQVPINVFLKRDFLAHQLADSGSGTVVVDREGLASLAIVIDGLPALRRVVVVDDVQGPVAGVEPVPYASLMAHDPADLPGPTDPDAALAILYTSGTTGPSKGCLVSHGYHVNIGCLGRAMFDLTEDDILVTAFPLFHNGGQAQALMHSMVSGMSVVFEPAFSASSFIARAREESATIALGVGPMAVAIAATPTSDDDRAHRLRLLAFAPLTLEQQDGLEARFGAKVKSEGYGQTECVPVTCSFMGGPRKRDSNGLPSPYLDVRLVDDHDNEVPVGAVGEIVVRPKTGNVMFSGYWDNPNATLATWRNLWHHTGDLGRRDEEGYFYFVDRKSDALRRRGENVSSIEVETAIRKHPAIAQVAVHAVPGALVDDDIKACIVFAPGASATPDELFEFLQREVPYFAVPRYIEVLDELPATQTTARVMKQQLRARGITEDTWDFEELGLVVAKSARR